MRSVLIFLGVVTVVLSAMLAREGLWWIALPDALFGVGIAFVAWESMRMDAHPAMPAPVSAPPPPPPAAPAPAPRRRK